MPLKNQKQKRPGIEVQVSGLHFTLAWQSFASLLLALMLVPPLLVFLREAWFEPSPAAGFFAIVLSFMAILLVLVSLLNIYWRRTRWVLIPFIAFLYFATVIPNVLQGYLRGYISQVWATQRNLAVALEEFRRVYGRLPTPEEYYAGGSVPQSATETLNLRPYLLAALPPRSLSSPARGACV